VSGSVGGSTTLVVTDSASGLQHSLPVSVSEIPNPTLTALAPFPATHVGSSSTVTLTAAAPYGDALQFILGNATADPFLLTGPTTCARNAATCQTQVTFSPPSAGSWGAIVGVQDLTSGYFSTTVSVGATGGVAAYSVPASYDFGTITIGTQASTTLTVTNTGDGTAVCPSFALSGTAVADYSLSGSQTGSPLRAGNSCTVGINVIPNGVGPRPATLTVTTSTGPVFTVALTTNGTF
jgi:hypothetical protein